MHHTLTPAMTPALTVRQTLSTRAVGAVSRTLCTPGDGWITQINTQVFDRDTRFKSHHLALISFWPILNAG